MKRVFVIFGTILTIVFVNAQNDSLSTIIPQKKMFDLYVETGTAISSFRGMGNIGTYFFSPGLTINATPRLSLKIKTFINQPFYSNTFFDEKTISNPYKQKKYFSFYTEGKYKLSEKLHIRGFIYQGKDNPGFSLNDPVYHYSNYYSIQNIQLVGLDYQLSKNIQISAEFRSVRYQSTPLYFY